MIHKVTILGPATVSFDDETKHFTVSNLTAPEVITSGGLVQPTPSAFQFATDGPDNPLPSESPFIVNGSTAPKPQMPDNPAWYVGVAKLIGWKPGELAELRVTYGADYYKVTEDGRAWCYVFGDNQVVEAHEMTDNIDRLSEFYCRVSQTPFPRVDPNSPTPMPPDDLFGFTPQVCAAFGIDPRNSLRVEWPPLTAVKSQHPDA